MTAIQVTSLNDNSVEKSPRTLYRVPQNFSATWASKGTPVEITYPDYPTFATLSETRIALLENYSHELQIYEFDGSNWTTVGNPLDISIGFNESITGLSSTQIAVANTKSGSQSITTYTFDGLNWSQTGNSFSLANLGAPDITALSSNVVALADTTSKTLTTYTFDGTNWTKTGNSLYISNYVYPAISALDSNTIASIDYSNDKLITFSWDGTDWTQTGNSLSITPFTRSSLTALNSTLVALANDSDNTLTTYKWDGSNWSTYGTPFSLGNITYPAIAKLTETRIAFLDTTIRDLKAFDFTIIDGSIPYVVSHNITDFTISAHKGNSSKPTSFSLADTCSATNNIYGISSCIDTNNIIHVAFLEVDGKASKVWYNTFDPSTDTFGTNELVISDIGEAPVGDNLYSDISIDSNNKPHIVYSEYPKINGSPTYTAMYTNKVSGTWKSSIILSRTKNIDCSDFVIVIDLDNKPFIGIHEAEGTYNLLAFIGNANDATSFTSYTVNQASQNMQISLAVDSAGDHIMGISIAAGGISDLLIYRHTYNTAWTFNSFGRANTYNNVISIVTVGLIIYVLYRDYQDSDLKYVKYENSSWDASPTILETGAFNTPIAKWGFWADSDSIGAMVTTSPYSRTTPLELDYIFIDETASPDIWWNTLSLSTPAIGKLLKYFNGSSWITKPLKYYNGSSWVTKPLKVN